jgi:hypothetical protein
MDRLLTAATARARGESDPLAPLVESVNAAASEVARSMTRRMLSTARKHGGRAAFASNDFTVDVRAEKTEVTISACREDERVSVRTVAWAGGRVGFLQDALGLEADGLAPFLRELAAQMGDCCLVARKPVPQAANTSVALREQSGRTKA